MSYQKTTWINDSAPALNATNLNKIEQGIADAHDGLAGKVDKETGKGLSEANYTQAEKTKLASIEQGAEPNVQPDWNATTGDAAILNKPSLASIATSGSYNDLSNKPTIPTVPTNVSAFTNDAGYLTEHQDISGKQDTLVSGTNIKTVNSTSLLGSGDVSVQETLVSGTNIKTINNNSLLGSGNITIQGGGGGSTVSYTPTVSSGTELGKINIDGNDNSVYAPTIPSNISAFTNDSGYLTAETDPTVPSWAKQSTKPTYTASEVGALPDTTSIPSKTSDLTNDSGFLTSHQSIKTINSTSLVGSGNVAVQPTLVSGTNIKTINNTSLLGSGNIATMTKVSTTVTISVADWSATTTCTKSVSGITTSNDVIVTPAPASISDWQSGGVYCSAQGSGTLTFTCSTTPSSAITVNVLIIN